MADFGGRRAGALVPHAHRQGEERNRITEKGQELELLTAERGSLKDVPAWARQTGHEVLSVEERNGEYCFRIKKG